MPTMSSLDRSLNSTPSRLINSPPKTRCNSGFAGSAGIESPQYSNLSITLIAALRLVRFSFELLFAEHLAQDPMPRPAGCQQRSVNRLDAIVKDGLPHEGRQRAGSFVHQKIGRRKVPVATRSAREGGVEPPLRNACEP